MLAVGGGRLVWGNTGREEDAMLGALERGPLTRHMEMLVRNACPRQLPNWLW
jgi:hypothetical protein